MLKTKLCQGIFEVVKQILVTHEAEFELLSQRRQVAEVRKHLVLAKRFLNDGDTLLTGVVDYRYFLRVHIGGVPQNAISVAPNKPRLRQIGLITILLKN